MKRNWRSVRLGDVAKVLTGPFGSLLHKSDYIEGGIPLINPINIRDGEIIVGTTKTLSKQTVARLRGYVLEKGDVIFARRGEIGRCAVINDEETGWLCGTGCFIIRPTPTIDPSYLSLLLSSPEYRERLEAVATGVTMKNLSNKKLEDLLISLPPLLEQRCIVAILDQAFEAIATATANAEKNIVNIRESFTSISEKLLGGDWPTLRLDELLITGKKISYGVLKPGTPTVGGVRLIKSQQIRDGFVDLKEDFRISKALDEEYSRTRLSGGEILLNVVGSIGRSAIAPIAIRNANVSRAIAVLPVRAELARWVQHNLQSPLCQRLMIDRSGGAAQPVLNLGEVKAFQIPMPTSAMRGAIVASLDDLEKSTIELGKVYKSKLAAFVQLRAALLQRAFSGELSANSALVAAE